MWRFLVLGVGLGVSACGSSHLRASPASDASSCTTAAAGLNDHAYGTQVQTILRDAITRHCEAEDWPDTVQRCMTDAASSHAAMACTTSLSQPQQAALAADVDAALRNTRSGAMLAAPPGPEGSTTSKRPGAHCDDFGCGDGIEGAGDDSAAPVSPPPCDPPPCGAR